MTVASAVTRPTCSSTSWRVPALTIARPGGRRYGPARVNAGGDIRIGKAMPWALIAAACLGSFAATSSGTTRAPFLIDMSHDLDVTMPLVANLVSLTATAWGLTSAIAGWLSDRIGRRILLVTAPLVLALAMVLQAVSGDFITLAAWAALSGAAAGTFTGVIYSEVSAHVEDRQRGRALGWVMSGQSLTLLIGVPMAAAVGAIIGWRGWLVCVGVLAAVASIALFATVPATRRRGARGAAGGGYSALSARLWALLGSGVAERICYGLAAVYYATFLQVTYGLSLAELALPLAVFAVGSVVGTLMGGPLADRLHDRLMTYAACMAASGVAALALFYWCPSPAVSVALGFLYVFVNSLGRPSLMATYAAVPEQMRGTVMGLTGASASLGWIGAAALGGLIVAFDGFDGFGPLAFVLALLGAAIAMACRKTTSS
ncbi:MAG: MFS transporter [Enhydrobacter sp.]|nr:MAG: MFS transporter [Enhydrobacter sp.]